jgi:single-strand DNA-binding protein
LIQPQQLDHLSPVKEVTMTRGLNKVMLIGRLGHDPEMRYTPSGKPLTKFQIAVNRSWSTAENEKKTETEWFTIVSWGKLAEICNQYLEKGRQVYIEGRLHSRSWKDEEGANHSTVEVVAQEMIMLGSVADKDDPDQPQEPTPEDEYPF